MSYAADYLNTVKDYKPKYRKQIKQVLRDFMQYFHYNVEFLRAEDIRDYLCRRKEEGERYPSGKNTLTSPHSFRKHLYTLKKFYSWMEQASGGQIKNPLKDITIPYRKK
jgi:site-specific recombinase XerD